MGARRLLSQLHFHSVIRDTRIDTSLYGHRADLGGDLTFVGGHNFRPAMCDDGTRHAFFLAPCQLRSNSDRLTLYRVCE
jgi:hypothetical protein